VALALGLAGEEVFGQGDDVLASVAQWRDVNGEGGQAVVQILTELAFRDPVLHVAVGGGDNAHIDLDVFIAADAADGAAFQCAQQLGL